MTPRGRLALALGCATYLAAWAFGSKPLYPVALGLFAAALLSRLWTRLAGRPTELRRRLPGGDRFSGDDVHVRLELAWDKRLPAATVVRERIGKLGVRETPVHTHGATSYVLEGLGRGRYAFEEATAVIEDPFGFDRVELELSAPGALLVYPRLVELERLFSETGASARDGRRLLLRRPSGFDLHSVREYQQGESLRMVHWRSTARRGRLMVKELEDAPRDEVAVLLDGDARATGGESFEIAVRAAGSILQSHLRRGRRCALVVNSAAREAQPVTSEADWRRALETLAGAQPDARIPAFALLQADGGAAARSLELVVVTSRVDVPLADRLVQRALSRRGASLVYVQASPAPEPQLLRLQAVGIPVAVVRTGDDLAHALGAREARVA